MSTLSSSPGQVGHRGCPVRRTVEEIRYKRTDTVLVIIKLKKLAVPVRLRCGSSELNFCHYFIKTLRCGAVAFIFSIYLKPVLYIL